MKWAFIFHRFLLTLGISIWISAASVILFWVVRLMKFQWNTSFSLANLWIGMRENNHVIYSKPLLFFKESSTQCRYSTLKIPWIRCFLLPIFFYDYTVQHKHLQRTHANPISMTLWASLKIRLTLTWGAWSSLSMTVSIRSSPNKLTSESRVVRTNWRCSVYVASRGSEKGPSFCPFGFVLTW